MQGTEDFVVEAAFWSFTGTDHGLIMINGEFSRRFQNTMKRRCVGN